MSWQDLLSSTRKVVLPWVGGRLHHGREYRSWSLNVLPPEYCWGEFECWGSKAKFLQQQPPDVDKLFRYQEGMLVGDRFVPTMAFIPEILEMPRVYLIEPGLPRFTPVRVGRISDYQPVIFASLIFPKGPEQEVAEAFEDRAESLDHIKGVYPGLEAAFQLESLRRSQMEARREQLRLEEERARQAREAQRLIGTGFGRRLLAKHDFEAAATAALKVSGAQYLTHEPAYDEGEYRVRYRLQNERYCCVVDSELRIIDAGICLEDHNTGEKGDTRFTLESLPAVVMQAIREHRLHVYRR